MTYRVKHIGLSSIQWDDRDPMPVPKGCEPCGTCKGEGWVCENHTDKHWSNGCCCGGAGSPCPECNQLIAHGAQP
jgi:hypothetical protein